MTHDRADQSELRWQVEVEELLGEASQRIHRVMLRFVESAAVAKAQINEIVDEPLKADAAEMARLQQELDRVREEIQQLRESPPASGALDPTDAEVIVRQARTHAADSLGPVRQASEHLSSIEQQVVGYLRPTRIEAAPARPIRVGLLLLEIESDIQAFSIAKRLREGQGVRAAEIVAFQPSRLELEVEVDWPDAVADRIVALLGLPLRRLPNEGNLLVLTLASP